MEDKIKNFILQQIKAMTENVVKNYDVREQKNPFQPFSGGNANEIIKYMSLGRSFDSQLGNRLQKICMFIARCKYGNEAVPNYIFVNISNNKIVLWLFSYPQNFVDEYGIDAYKTQIITSIENKDDISKRIIKLVEDDIKSKYRRDKGIKQIREKEHKEEVTKLLNDWNDIFDANILEYVYDNCTSSQIDQAKKIKQNEIQVDLIYFRDQDNVFLYEIKASGGLDTKNRSGNANEVIRNENILSFIKNVNSYFAACYNNCGEFGDDIKNKKGVKFRGNFPNGPMFNIVSKEPGMNGKIIVGSVFWEQILPDTISFERFIEIYMEAFESSEIEKKINEL